MSSTSSQETSYNKHSENNELINSDHKSVDSNEHEVPSIPHLILDDTKQKKDNDNIPQTSKKYIATSSSISQQFYNDNKVCTDDPKSKDYIQEQIPLDATCTVSANINQLSQLDNLFVITSKVTTTLNSTDSTDYMNSAYETNVQETFDKRHGDSDELKLVDQMTYVTVSNQQFYDDGGKNSTDFVETKISAEGASTVSGNINQMLPLGDLSDTTAGSASDPLAITSNVRISSDDTDNVYNILLLGETGVGKSTFLNAFINYIHFYTLDQALSAKEVFSLMPSRFTITDAEFNMHDIKFGKPDENEKLKPGEPSTKTCKSYKFRFGDISLRFVDTPGVVDTRGIEKDEEHLVNLIDYLAEIEYVNAILILLKPNESKLTILFQYCIKRLLSCLERSAIENIIFLFTNSRSTFYRPGDVVQPLKIILSDIAKSPPHIEVPFSSKNTFCVDSEAFRYLVAKRQGCPFEEGMHRDFAESWETSANTCDRLLQYVTNLGRHSIKNSVSVMEARKTVEKLRWPLGKIMQFIAESIRKITEHERRILQADTRIDELAKDLLYTRMALKVRHLDKPRTVCTHRSCCEYKLVDEVIKIHYKVICHQPCTLRKIPEHLVGEKSLEHCWAMIDGLCRRCDHSYLLHQHVYYETESYIDTLIDEKIKTDIDERETERELIEKTLKELMQRKLSYEGEKKSILKAMAKFTHFLENSAILPYNDAFEKYVQQLIERENTMGQFARKTVIDDYEMLIKAYHEEVNTLKQELEMLKRQDSRVSAVVTTSEVMEVINDLYKLDLTGQYIKEMYDIECDYASRVPTHQNSEEIIEVVPPKAADDKKRSQFKWLYKVTHKIKTAFTPNIEYGLEAAGQSICYL